MIYICMYVCMYVYIYIYIERERERKREGEGDRKKEITILIAFLTWKTHQLTNLPNSFVHISKFTVLGTLCPHTFSQIITTFGVKIRPALKS